MIKSYYSTESDSGSDYDFNYIRMIINALEDEFRIPLNMFLDGYKYHEIAKYLNIPLGTVKSRIFLSRKKILKILNQDDSFK
jgi:RNA polymerase sigma-70 factor (ECF subfamily)